MKHNILHLNSNFFNSSVHNEIVESFNSLENVEGKVFVPRLKYDNIQKNEKDYLIQKKCLNLTDKLFLSHRSEKLYKILNKEINFSDFTSILAHSLFSNGLLARKICHRTNLNYTVIVTNTDINLYLKYPFMFRKIALDILLDAEKIFFTAPFYLSELIDKVVPGKYEQKIRNKTIITPFGINQYWLDNVLKQERKIPTDPLKILYVGKVNKNKNIKLIVNTLERENKSHLQYRLQIVGYATDKYGEKFLENINKYAWVSYLGKKGKKELLDIYRNADIFVMTSFKESFGLVYGEAMSQGLPVVYTVKQGFDGHFEEDSIGYAVNPYSSSELIDVLKIIRMNYSKMSDSARNEVNKLSWENVVQNFMQGIED
ncbi:glycosyltransferase family 4 protein [Enterococcus dongliensis]|uniref:glycosyltransferase family 4 protein n=1 Tax=Enterococcus dongliensis TaxID=2559925 RepID=UPI00288E6002|nr:glycosyltransferase family 4 protein [Enterococcus dongliensis]MDT2674683.1 glycosyltransferase family 4 protein [Enterococcus dongliensis]